VAQRAPLRVADVAMLYGERSDAVRAYLDAKARHAVVTGAFEHHVLVPGPCERHSDAHHELPSLRVARADGYRLALGARAVKRTLSAVRPDVVFVHDPFALRLGVVDAARGVGAKVVAVHHRSSALDAARVGAPPAGWAPVFRAWLRRAYDGADAIASAVDPEPDCGRPATFPLRLGVHEAFRPRPGRVRADHVLFAGRLVRAAGVDRLLDAAAAAEDPWPLRIFGCGPAEERLRRRAHALGLGLRVSFSSFVADPHRLARAYAGAACVVLPGEHEAFGLVALEAGACGAPAVACSNTPSVAELGALAHTFDPGDTAGLLAAIAAARAAAPDPFAAAALGGRLGWERCFAGELEDLRELVL
jgi:alpha-1,6-mannosyltransferase